MDLKIFNETTYKIDEAKLKDLLLFAAQKEKKQDIAFNVIIVDNPRIKEINKTYRNLDQVTDVISFALEDDKSFPIMEICVLGDIYISIEKAKEQALIYEHSEERELCFLAVHGFLHLLGYDHMNEDDEKIMFARQREILDEFGIKR